MSAVRLILSVLLFKEALTLSGNFWHITDLHWDPTYKPNNNPELVCASSGKRPAASAGKFGEYVCDSPWHLINSSVYAMKSILPDPDFIIWTGLKIVAGETNARLQPRCFQIGIWYQHELTVLLLSDDTPHVPDEDLGEEAVLNIISNITHVINQVFPNTKVYSALGNHDYHPKSQLPAAPNSMYDRIAEMWQDWLDPESKETFKKGGYYTETLMNQTGFRILVLNTNLYYDQNKLTQNMEDPADQYRWSDEVLTKAANDKEKVYIIGHIPPGFFEKKRSKPWFTPKFNQQYLDLIQRHHSVIKGQFFGHHHTDSFRMFYNPEGSPISTMFLSPGVTPWKTTLPGVVDGANNPGIRVFEYDTETLLVKDVVTYYLNLTHANAATGRWEKEYRLTESFRVQDASPASMHQVLELMANNHCYLQKYYDFNSVSYDLKDCGSDCRVDHVCAAREVDFDRYERCLLKEGAVFIYGGLLPLLSVALSLMVASE